MEVGNMRHKEKSHLKTSSFWYGGCGPLVPHRDIILMTALQEVTSRTRNKTSESILRI